MHGLKIGADLRSDDGMRIGELIHVPNGERPRQCRNVVGRRASVDRLFLDTIPGVGLNSSDDHVSDPQAMLRYSDDGSKTWSNELTAPVGTIGQFDKKVEFSQLGETGEDGRNWELSMSAAVIRGLTGAAVDVELLEP